MCGQFSGGWFRFPFGWSAFCGWRERFPAVRYKNCLGRRNFLITKNFVIRTKNAPFSVKNLLIRAKKFLMRAKNLPIRKTFLISLHIFKKDTRQNFLIRGYRFVVYGLHINLKNIGYLLIIFYFICHIFGRMGIFI